MPTPRRKNRRRRPRSTSRPSRRRRPPGPSGSQPGSSAPCGSRLGRGDRVRSQRRRLGAGGRGRSERALCLHPCDAFRGQAVSRQLPRSVAGPSHLDERRQHVRRLEAVVRVQGLMAVRPHHRGREEHRCGVRGLPQRLQHGLHDVDEPRSDLERSGHRLRQRLLDGQASPHDVGDRERCVHLVERPERRRSVDVGVA